jgi:hypothetical protein
MQEQVNLFLAEINFDVFENVIVTKILYICFTKVYTRSYYWTKAENDGLHEAELALHLADCTDSHKEIVLTLDYRRLYGLMTI